MQGRDGRHRLRVIFAVALWTDRGDVRQEPRMISGVIPKWLRTGFGKLHRLFLDRMISGVIPKWLRTGFGKLHRLFLDRMISGVIPRWLRTGFGKLHRLFLDRMISGVPSGGLHSGLIAAPSGRTRPLPVHKQEALLM